jgi:SulP family sulfate permease
VRVVILDLSDVTMIDTSIALAIEDVVARAGGMGVAVFLVGLRAPVRRVLQGLAVLDRLPAGHVVARRLDALHAAADMAVAQDAEDALAARAPGGSGHLTPTG